MLGVIYPLIYEYLFNQKISVGAPFYTAIFSPIVLFTDCFIILLQKNHTIYFTCFSPTFFTPPKMSTKFSSTKSFSPILSVAYFLDGCMNTTRSVLSTHSCADTHFRICSFAPFRFVKVSSSSSNA